jgi:outer membrane protein assembly factor BamD (BamD/ComL family)
MTRCRIVPDPGQSFSLRETLQKTWLILTAIVLFTSLHSAAEPAADPGPAFNAAASLFRDGWYDRAEKQFGELVANFPNATNLNEAVLLQAQSRFQLQRYSDALSLLESQLPAAGPLADQFRYWQAEAQFHLGQFEAAANSYATILNEFPSSALCLPAVHGQAFAKFKINDIPATISLLQGPESAFHKAAANNTNEMTIVRGKLLLAEALFAGKQYRASEQILTDLAQRSLSQEYEWQRQFLLTRIEMADHRHSEALLRVTNLVAIASSGTNTSLQARALTLHGELLEEKQLELASHAYEAITRLHGITPEQQRQALLKIIDLAVIQDQFTNAIQRLGEFLKQNPQDPAVDLIHLTVGELYLKHHHSMAAKATNRAALVSSGTNLLSQARSQFDQIINQFTNSQHLGKAHLNRGWAIWEEAQLLNEPSRLQESQKAFQSAINSLPKSYEQASARFKLADGYFQLKNFTNSLNNYRLLLEQYADLPDVRDKLLDHALHQSVRASIALRDFPQAKTALDTLLRDYPASPWRDHALLAFGRALLMAGDLAKAQEIFAEFEKSFPASQLLPEARLLAASTSARQNQYAAAIGQYEQWLATYTNHHSRPQVEFDRAWAHYQAGQETNALSLFARLVKEHPASPPAPLAQLWIADYHFNQRQYQAAESNYQLLFKTSDAIRPDLSKQARIMAAKAAFFRWGYKEARAYLTELIEDPRWGPEAYFMLGDIEIADDTAAATNKLARFEEAIKYFDRITNTRFFPTNRFVPLALGRIADCHFQLAVQYTNSLDQAATNYHQVIFSGADIATRSNAEIGLAKVLEKMAEQRPNKKELLEQALSHCLKVVYSERLKGEDPDPFFVKEAAMFAGRLAERLQRFEEAERLYESMLRSFPSLRPEWEKRLQAVRQQKSR